ncbi:armadillo repeat-containing X-linked protein 3 [Enhydra lutris kenyoni]|uniref:Armadillo repeat-containing X-linked protein 3 n=1 Tax=Enhydra lutris kenyoni TaxID=391180 RepID=A0A2Y9L7A7_ENHLU|nr:armadillo repeat-containing X-linked protein 3 [Enhydra lutris kenyoni]XP_022377326.1 armadillo repeat-containing X-linked protein 3 [Enhydra lutris kenyoni]XP_022377327.1 armadillo repeat-containing X-linked protein 3 [Enhydra lutris kenyoni]XP_022377328.1 armadillo repeat-containing X-linked protein 3 [Enhydra lutris kenyoni]
MGYARKVGWVTAGLVIGAGACYCIYRLTRGRKQNKEKMAEGGSGDVDDVGDCPGARYNDWSDDDDDSSDNKGIVWYPPWARIGTEAGTRARARARARATRARRAVQKRASPNSDDTILSPQELQKVLCLVEMSEKPYILEAALIALGNNAAYAFNRDIIRDLGGLPIVAKILNTRDPIVKEKALIVLNNLSVNAENQRRLKIYMNQVCDDTITSRLNSSVQLAGLRLLTNMTVTNEYQHMLANSISDFFRLFSAGNEETKFQVLKLLLNLAENPAMARELLRAQVPSSLGSLFNKKENKEVILKLLVIFENINDNFKWEENEPTQNPFSEGSLFFFLKEFQVSADKILGIESHHDFLVKVKVGKFIAKLAEHMFPKTQE